MISAAHFSIFQQLRRKKKQFQFQICPSYDCIYIRKIITNFEVNEMDGDSNDLQHKQLD